MVDMTVSGLRLKADVDEALTAATIDYTLGQVAQLNVSLTDTADLMARNDLARWGTRIDTAGTSWEVGGLHQAYRANAIDWDVRAYSQLAKELRDNWRSKVTGVKSTDWVTSRGKAAGGRVITQPSARKAKLQSSDDQTVLDVIDALAQDLGWTWCEYDGLLLFMDPHWAWKNPGEVLPRWMVTWGKDDQTDALQLELDLSNEDDSGFGTGTLALPSAAGRRLRPLHTVYLGSGIKGALAGTWVVTSVSRDLMRPEATVEAQIARPRQGVPQQRTSSSGLDTVGTGSGPIGVEGGWIEGADRRWKYPTGWTRTPREYVRLALSRNNTGYAEARCLQWVSEIVSGSAGRGGMYARYVWEKRPPGTPTTSSRTPQIGMIVVWDQESKGGHGGTAGHIGISLGGGKFISATSGRVQILTISGGWLGGYLGAMAPNFYT